MLIEIKKHGPWRCLSNPRQQDWVRDLPEIPELLGNLKSLPKTLKDNHRSLVLLGDLSGKHLVAKQPRDKNRRLWARVLSYFEQTEASQTLSTLERFHELGISSVQPLFVLEKRVLGAVVDSWLCYEYRDGTPCNEFCVPGIIGMLRKMHLVGFRHNDPNLGNFLIDENDEMFVLDSRGRKRSGNFSDANDFFLFKKINKTITDFQVSDVEHLDSTTLGYRLAFVYTKIKSARSFLKDKVRKTRSKNTEQDKNKY
ncbi:MAG: hypothetical protein ACI9SP_004194 [Arenicella sp.]|jgi:hypothetical protein